MLHDVELCSPLAEVDLSRSALIIDGKFLMAQTALIELKLHVHSLPRGAFVLESAQLLDIILQAQLIPRLLLPPLVILEIV